MSDGVVWYDVVWFGVIDGDKYRVDERGLRIDKLDLRDNGTYECRAEVSSHGNLKVRTVTVDVQCQSLATHSPSPRVLLASLITSYILRES